MRMVVGRPREFDREVALERAMEVFWAKGYEATSVQDLLDAMSINRGSMYDTFGDKHALFMAAFEHYAANFERGWKSVLEAPGSPLGNVRRLLGQVATMASDPAERGCMITNCAIEWGRRDPAVGNVLKGVFKRLEKGVRHRVENAIEAGELPRGAKARPLARFVVATIQGLIVMGKSTHNRKELNEVVEVAVSALK